MKPETFKWHTIDVRNILPDDWKRQVEDTASAHAKYSELVPTSVTSREAAGIDRIPVLTVGGAAATDRLAWLHRLYHGRFRELAEEVFCEPVRCAQSVHYGINLNVQRGTEMRYECHVDSNPIGGLLYATTHPPGSGGELVVSNRGDVRGAAEIEQDCSRVYPVAGHLVLFDARRHSHYVAPLTGDERERIVVAMNFYTGDAPETDRPDDLNHHLFGASRAQEEAPLS